MNEVRVAHIMDGSRRHYDVAQALHRERCLHSMFTSWYSPPGSWEAFVGRGVRMISPKLGQKMLERYCQVIPSEMVRANPWLMLRGAIAKRQFRMEEEYFEWMSFETAKWIEKKGILNANGMYGYVRNIHPRLCKNARDEGVVVVGEQMIAPAAIERQQAQYQQERWPGWENPMSNKAFDLVQENEQKTWENLDRIVAPSQYVVEGLVACGVDADLIDLIPYPGEFESIFSNRDYGKQKDQFTIGFVGQINLRKNAPIFMEIAKKMKGEGVRFTMVGRNYLNQQRIDEYRPYVNFTGAVARSQIRRHLDEFDVFFFPSTCEGSAGVVLEAMAEGLPIITTPNSGTIVEHGENGFVATPNDIETFIQYITLLKEDPTSRLQMGMNSQKRVSELTIEEYGKKLVHSFQKGTLFKMTACQDNSSYDR